MLHMERPRWRNNGLVRLRTRAEERKRTIAGTGSLARSDQDTVLDNTNHDLIHALSVRLDAQWHDKSYRSETLCPSCMATFERVQEMDREAVRLLSIELREHVQDNKFPADLVDQRDFGRNASGKAAPG
jgi:hypothetical protein